MSIQALRQAAKKEKPILGVRETIRRLRAGSVRQVFLARNCPAATKATISHLAKLCEARIVEMEQPNDEIGVLLKRGHPISVLSFTSDDA